MDAISGPRLLRVIVSTLCVQMFLGQILYCYKYYNVFITGELGHLLSTTRTIKEQTTGDRKAKHPPNSVGIG